MIQDSCSSLPRYVYIRRQSSAGSKGEISTKSSRGIGGGCPRASCRIWKFIQSSSTPDCLTCVTAVTIPPKPLERCWIAHPASPMRFIFFCLNSLPSCKRRSLLDFRSDGIGGVVYLPCLPTGGTGMLLASNELVVSPCCVLIC